ncbi:MAG: DsbA family protein [Vibrio sp.]
MQVRLFYVHDPMCSWCWGFRPTFEALKHKLEARHPAIELEYVLGGLAPDSDEVMPAQMQHFLIQTWKKIQSQLGTEFNFEFWDKVTPVRNTYSACRAVLAAQNQGAGEAMIDAIQKAYYLEAQAPHLKQTHMALAQNLGLDLITFESDLLSQSLEDEFQRQRELAQALNAQGFPSLILGYETLQGLQITLIRIDYLDADAMLEQIESMLTQLK